MFDYDKLAKKLGKFENLSNKKQGKLLEYIFCSDDFRSWFYGIGDAANEQPMTKQMANKIFGSLSNPTTMKRLTKFVKNKTYEEFDHTSCTLAFLAVEQAVEASNAASRELVDNYKNGELPSKEAKNYRERSDQYNEYVTKLLDALKDKARPEIKDICKKTNLPKGLVANTYFIVPGRKFIPKYKASMYVNQLLQSIYTWVGNNGVEDVSSIKWGSYFGSFFGSEMTSSSAITIMLEGVRRIDAYRDAEYFDNVREVWDSLTNFAMTELDRAPEHTRRQMIEIYIKKIDRLFTNGNGPRLRVDMLNIPSSFHNLSDTVSRYSDRISKITKSGSRQVENIQKQFVKNNRNDDDESEKMSAKEVIEKHHKLSRNDDEEDDAPPFNFDDDNDEDDDD